MLAISENLVARPNPEFPPYSPLVGWHNLVTAQNLSADTENALFPAVNLATVNTAEKWKAADTTEQRIIIAPDYRGAIDYVAISGHNFASARISVSIEAYREEDEGGPIWLEVSGERFASRDGLMVFRFEPLNPLGICLRLRAGNAPATIAVLYVGKLLVLPPNIQLEYTPLPYGRVSEDETDITENGEFLGRTILSTTLESSVVLPYLDPDWYREEMDPFIAACATTPFFFAWDPLHYPKEVGFAWIKKGSNPQPKIHQINGMMTIQLDMGGIVA